MINRIRGLWPHWNLSLSSFLFYLKSKTDNDIKDKSIISKKRINKGYKTLSKGWFSNFLRRDVFYHLLLQKLLFLNGYLIFTELYKTQGATWPLMEGI